MFTATREIRGFTFGFVSGDINGADGLVIDPNTFDLKQPEYYDALTEALQAAKGFLAFASIYDTVRSPYVVTLDFDQLMDFSQKIDLVFEQDFWQAEEFDLDKEKILKIPEYFTDKYHDKFRRVAAKTEQENTRIRPGYVYLIQSSTGYYKIGRTTNPENRIKTFGVKLPFEVEYTCVIQTQDMYTLEAKLHQQFNHKRVNGEWFNLAPSDVEYIKSLAVES